MSFRIGRRTVGEGQPVFLIAEVGLAHDGSLIAAHAYIDAVARAGVDAVKFQCHRGDPVSAWRVLPGWLADGDRQAYWKRTDFSDEGWSGLVWHCDDVGLEFLCSPFSVEAVEFLDPLVRAWKIPSGKIKDTAMLDAVAATGKPVLKSNGMGTGRENCDAKARLWDGSPTLSRPLLMECVSEYPSNPEHIGLYRGMEGLSDHSGTIYPGIAAAALGACVVEVHVCFNKEQGGFDVEASLDMDQLAQLVEGVRFVEQAMRPVDKDALAKELEPMRKVFMA